MPRLVVRHAPTADKRVSTALKPAAGSGSFRVPVAAPAAGSAGGGAPGGVAGGGWEGAAAARPAAPARHFPDAG